MACEFDWHIIVLSWYAHRPIRGRCAISALHFLARKITRCVSHIYRFDSRTVCEICFVSLGQKITRCVSHISTDSMTMCDICFVSLGQKNHKRCSEHKLRDFRTPYLTMTNEHTWVLPIGRLCINDSNYFFKVSQSGVLTYARWCSLSRGSEIAQFMLATLITRCVSHIDRFYSISIVATKKLRDFAPMT